MRAALVVIVLACASGADADARQDLANARELQGTLDYAGALRIVDEALARGGADAQQYVELHLLGGSLAAGLDRASDAEAHFARVLALRPDTVLPAGTSPKITTPFDAAKAKSTPLAITITNVRGLVTIAPIDPLGLVAGISVHVVDTAGAHRDVVDRAGKRIAIPAGTTAIEVTALDANGHRIWTGAPPAPIAEPIGVPRVASRPLYKRWGTWAVVTGAALATGGLAAWRFSVAQDDFDRLRASGTFDELQAAEERGTRWGLVANIAFGTALVTGVISTVVFVTTDDEATTVGVAGRF